MNRNIEQQQLVELKANRDRLERILQDSSDYIRSSDNDKNLQNTLLAVQSTLPQSIRAYNERILASSTLNTSPEKVVADKEVQTDNEPTSQGELDSDTTSKCFICWEPSNDSPGAMIECGHWYCSSCLTSGMRLAEHLPLTCCNEEVDLEAVAHLLPSKVVEACRKGRKRHIQQTSIYCSTDDCHGFFLGRRSNTQDKQQCGRCGRLTCMKCSMRQHMEACGIDIKDQALLDLAEQKGWQRCPGCEMFVERVGGCREMTCICGTEFCYGCGTEFGYRRRPEDCNCS